jgi:hypothetical protein
LGADWGAMAGLGPRHNRDDIDANTDGPGASDRLSGVLARGPGSHSNRDGNESGAKFGAGASGDDTPAAVPDVYLPENNG